MWLIRHLWLKVRTNSTVPTFVELDIQQTIRLGSAESSDTAAFTAREAVIYALWLDGG